MDAFWPEDQGHGVLGLNVSPLIERYRRGGQDLRTEVMQFIRAVVQDHGMAVLLVPHIIPLNGDSKNNDAVYMQQILDAISDLVPKVRMMDSTLNASQIKWCDQSVPLFHRRSHPCHHRCSFQCSAHDIHRVQC